MRSCRSIPTLARLAALFLACTAHREETPPEAIAVTPVVAAAREPVTIEVFAEWPEHSVIEVEHSLVRPLEKALLAVPDVKRIHSSARAGRATIVLTLDARADPRLSIAAVDDHLALARPSLPAEVFPGIGPDLAGPASALVFALTPTTADSMQLHRTAEALRDALVMLPGVGEVSTCGGREPRLVVALDPARLTASRLSVAAVVQALTSSLRDEPRMPLGVLTVAGTRGMDDLMALIVAQGEHPVALRDVASIAVEPGIRACEAARLGGAMAVVGLVRARRGADLQALETALRAELAARGPELAAQGVSLEAPAGSPLRFALDLTATANPAETLAHANRAIGDAFTAAGPSFAGRFAFVQATTPSQVGMWVDGELLLDVTGLAVAELAALERRLGTLPGLGVRGPLDDPSRLSFRITGDELDVDRRLAREAAEIAATVPGVLRAAARDDQRPELALELKRERLAALGLTAPALFGTLAAALDGAPAGQVQMDGSRMPVIVRIGAGRGADRSAQLAALPGLEIGLPAGGTVRLDELVDIRAESVPGTITRVDGRRSVTVEVRVADSTAAQLVALQQALARSLQLPPGHALVWD